ncbi:tRNA (guanine(46)-N(7))-methyltransferase TrmB [Lapillicoccus sp.]|uniref:tRNA (guanine(46)-N(7))-methyltransferase TrmB n=1 Tax=Lapillicoccus sp. TaxID=1909287 RepID=UPI0025CEC89B|nr:tRNA (guanine(46)-N(7))-methyltransferase TrmB [Lapillicoccus sp.]
MSLPADDRLPPLTDGRVRTFAGRKGKLSELSRHRLDRLGPRWELPPGPLDARTAFGRAAPLVLEIGSGHGAAAVAYAAAHPGHDLVAVDVHVPGIARLLGVVDAAGVTNLRVVRGDAVEVLRDRIGPAQLDAVHLFFPDPWPKEKHKKRRFVSAQTLDLLASRLTPGGTLLVATRPGGIRRPRGEPGRAARGLRSLRHAAARLATDGRVRGQRHQGRPVDHRPAGHPDRGAGAR